MMVNEVKEMLVSVPDSSPSIIYQQRHLPVFLELLVSVCVTPRQPPTFLSCPKASWEDESISLAVAGVMETWRRAWCVAATGWKASGRGDHGEGIQ